MNLLKYLSWDSQCFGYKIGEILASTDTLEKAIKQAYQENYRLLYYRANPNDEKLNLLAQNLRGVLVDEKVTFVQKIPQKFPYSKAKLYLASILHPDLLQLALQSGAFSRFKLDKNFKNNEYEKLYTAWIENSVRKEIAKEIIIYQPENEIVGMLTLTTQAQLAYVGLLAVHQNYQKQGIGKELLWKAFETAQNWRASHLQIVMQRANQKACLFYEKMGFQIEKIENIYHFWL